MQPIETRSITTHVAFVPHGENGGCRKSCGSNNCAYAVFRKKCPGIDSELNLEGGDVCILCDSEQVSDKNDARTNLVGKVRILTSGRKAVAA